MCDAGVPYSGPIESGRGIKRIYVEGDKKGTRNGWYMAIFDERPAGAFGTNKGGARFTWKATTGLADLTKEEREAMAERQRRDKEAAERAEAERQAAAAAFAASMWDNALPATDHPYLSRKGVPSYGLRVGDWLKKRDDGSTFVAARGALLIPLKDGRGLVSLQAIFAKPIKVGDSERDKDFISGGRKRGCWHTIGAPTEFDGRLTVLIGEGYATCATVHRATGLGVVVAFDAGNLIEVGKAVRALMPDARLIFAADNDQWTGPTPENPRVMENPGVTLARRAAEEVRGEVIAPVFANVDTRPTDFNDLEHLEGLDEVGHQLLAVLRPPVENPLDAPPAPAVDPDNAPAEYAVPKTGLEQAGEAPAPDDDDVDTNGYFRVLGHDRDSLYVYQFEKRMITQRGETDWSENALMTLAPLHWWEFNFPGEKGGLNRKMAVNWLLRTAYKRGFFDPNSRRGRGAWRDDGRIVYHFGDKLWADGQMMPVTSLSSSYVYEQARRLRHPHAEHALSGEDGRKIIESAKLFHWSRPASALLLCGFVALAPICGALSWRPHVWITGGAGCGKALPHSEPVLTPDGWATMGDMRVGAYVTTPDGGYGMVTGVYPQGVQDVWKITFADGRVVRASGDHLWKARIKGDWRIRTTDQMREILARGSRQSTQLAVPLSDPVEIVGADYRVALPLHPYALGALLGDGCLGANADGSGEIGFTSYDSEIVDRIRAVCSEDGWGLFERGGKGQFRFGDLSRYGRTARKMIKDLRLIGARSNNKFIPRAYLEASIADRIELLKGLMDTDGTICRRGGMSFCTVSPDLRDGVVELVRSLGGMASVSEKQTFYTIDGEKRTGQKAFNISIRLKDRSIAFSVPRKMERAAAPYQYEDCLYLNVVSIERDGEEECSCIAIDHPDRLFLTRDFTVTHNTTILKEWLWPLMNGCCIFAQGNSTEAGIRQTLKMDSLPVLFDESEQNDEREESRVQAILSLIRQSSTESEARTLKGTAGGDAQDFMIRSMFCLSSIQVGMKHQADFERLTVLALQPKLEGGEGDSAAAENWKVLSGMLAEIRGDSDLPARLMRRSLALLPKTLRNIETFSRAAAEAFGSQRDGDQYGTLIAGAWSLFSSEEATLEQAKALIAKYDWGDYRENTETEESTKALSALMGRLVRHKGGEVSIYELVEKCALPNTGSLSITVDDADAILRRHGMMVKIAGAGNGHLFVSNTSHALRELMHGTAYAADLKGQLLRVPEAERHQKTENFAGERAKAVRIPLYRIVEGLQKKAPPEPQPSDLPVDDTILF